MQPWQTGIKQWQELEDAIFGANSGKKWYVSLLAPWRQHTKFPQKALARAIYSRSSLLILDDVFTRLDAKTSQVVLYRLFGRDGILRNSGTTVIMSADQSKSTKRQLHRCYLTTYIATHFAFTDAVFNLSDNGTLQKMSGYSRSLALSQPSPSANTEIQNYPAHPEEDIVTETAVNSTAASNRKKDQKPIQSEIHPLTFFLQPAGQLTIFVWVVAMILTTACEKMPRKNDPNFSAPKRLMKNPQKQ